MLSNETKAKLRLFKYFTVSTVCAAVLAACGGGGGESSGSIGTPAEEVLVMDSGSSLSVTGIVSTSDNLLTTLTWSVAKLDPAAPNLTLSNENCAVVAKSDTKFNPIGADATKRTGESRWSCDLGVIAPAGFAKQYGYRLILTGVDDKGNSHLTTKNLNVNMDNAPPDVAVLPTFTLTAGAPSSTVIAGSTISRYCLPDPSSLEVRNSIERYYWVPVNDIAKNLDLDWFTVGFGTTNRLSFIAPQLPVGANTLSVQCVAVKTNGDSVISAPVNITIEAPAPTPEAPVVPTTLSAEFTDGVSVKTAPGLLLTLPTEFNWSLGTGVTKEPDNLLYDWDVVSVTPVISERSASASTTSDYLIMENAGAGILVSPRTVLSPEIVRVQLRVIGDENANGIIDATDTVWDTAQVDVLVDPYGPLSVSINPAAGAVNTLDVLSFNASLSSSSSVGDAPGYYRWSIFSSDDGVAIDPNASVVSSTLLGGSTTPTVGFVVPAAAAGKYLILRVEVSYTPFRVIDGAQDPSFDTGVADSAIYKEQAVIYVRPTP